MPSTNLLLERLQTDYPNFHFKESAAFEWQPDTKTIHYSPLDEHFDARLLHEVSHAVLKHSRYSRDIDLIAMERDAWQHAMLTLAPLYDTHIKADDIHEDMDTYREWLHARSTCPKCEANGLQLKKYQYRCLVCAHRWKVNEARVCALRRYDI